MISRNQSLKINLAWVAALSGSLLVSLSTISLAGGPPPQGKPVAQPNSTPAAPQTTIPPKFPLPSARVAPSEGALTIKLVNNTNVVINYQIVGQMQERSLEKGAEIQLTNLKTPLNITYQRQDGGLLMASPKATNPQLLEVSFSATDNFSADTKSMNIQADGIVFLN
ncbi:hypothetical protein BCD67_23900 [Oscillatoriales cyanobacterium USR001]|nr:hypothetical protein BCD67_23900 [Oscillatoriales cyanobacterium USR001]